MSEVIIDPIESEKTNSSYRSCDVLGVNFIDESPEKCVEVVSNGGLLVIPSGPGLATIDSDAAYRESVQGARYALADSGYFVLLMLFFKFRKISRVSGLRFIDTLLDSDALKKSKDVLWVMPSEDEIDAAKSVIEKRGLDLERNRFWVAPYYMNSQCVKDENLLEKLEKERPEWVILNIAGGKQEKLGHYLQENLSYTPSIVCSGAAIAFLSGKQAYIPSWVDRMYLGWLSRIIQNPRFYTKRYLEASTLITKVAFSRKAKMTRSEKTVENVSSFNLNRSSPSV